MDFAEVSNRMLRCWWVLPVYCGNWITYASSSSSSVQASVNVVWNKLRLWQNVSAYYRKQWKTVKLGFLSCQAKTVCETARSQMRSHKIVNHLMWKKLKLEILRKLITFFQVNWISTIKKVDFLNIFTIGIWITFELITLEVISNYSNLRFILQLPNFFITRYFKWC